MDVIIDIVIVEDNVELAELLVSTINTAVGFSLKGLAKNGEEAIRLVSAIRPDVVLMDIGLPDISGIECVKILKPMFPRMEFMAYTAFEDAQNLIQAIAAGVNSYILKSSPPEVLLAAIRELYAGGAPATPDIARMLIEFMRSEMNRTTDKASLSAEQYHISSREKEVLQCLSEGLYYAEIAENLKITVGTVKKHIYNIYEKLHVDNRTEAINKFFGSAKTL